MNYGEALDELYIALERGSFVGPIGPCDRTGSLTDIECFDAFVLVDKKGLPYWELRNRWSKPARHKPQRKTLAELQAAYETILAGAPDGIVAGGEDDTRDLQSPFEGSDAEYTGNAML